MRVNSADFLAAWSDADVPAIEIVFFDPRVHNYLLPWWYKETMQPCLGFSNPVKDTAYHISCFLPKYPNELRAAYFMHAFCKERLGFIPYTQFFSDVALPIFREYNEHPNWWNGNARYVLPPLKETMKDYRWIVWESRVKDWSEVVTQAAWFWRRAAEQFVIVMLPDWMERDSFEYRRYLKFAEEKRKR